MFAESSPMADINPILATDYTGALEGLIWFVVHGFYLIMLLITAIACIGRRTRKTDDLTHSLVWGGIVLFSSLVFASWPALSRNPPDWNSFWWFTKVSVGLWSAALILRWWHQRT